MEGIKLMMLTDLKVRIRLGIDDIYTYLSLCLFHTNDSSVSQQFFEGFTFVDKTVYR